MNNNNFNNYNLSNEEIDVILKKFQPYIKHASVIYGKINEDCEQNIRLAIFRKLSHNRKKQ